jgi:tripartite ATP-independent transporter DctP family solute receptor
MITHLGFRHVTNSKRPITTPADLKGLKIRTQSNPLHLMGFKAFGASPMPLSFAELFTALQQGVMDGQENPIYNIYAIKLYEIQDYLSLTSHLYTGGVMLMNEENYQSLPADIREAIDKAAVAGREACISEITESESIWLKEMEPKIEINKLSHDQILAFQEIAKSQWPKMAKKIGVDYFNAIQKKIETIQNSVQ